MSGADEGAPDPRHRRIRSFVRREGRITAAQADALATLLPQVELPFAPEAADLDALFGRRAPRVLEIGFGDGEALLARCLAHPEEDHLGIEVHRPGVGRLLHEAAKAGATNLRVSTHDAVEVLERQIPDASLARVLLFFPDPWPKKRHHKRRIVQSGFVALVARKLAPGGRFHLATDWEPYATQMLEVLSACPALENTAAGGGFASRPDDRPATRFERRGQRLGHGVWDLEFAARIR
jgi:tRNA (guanine-N7-)-methyltransferase